MKTYEDDEDLPWDPLWEYVLGEEDEKPRGSWWRKKKVEEDKSIMSYLFPESENRDESGNRSMQEKSVEIRESGSSSGIVRRSSQSESEGRSTEANGKGGKFWKRGKKSKNESTESNGWTGEWEIDPAISSAFVSHSDSDKKVRPKGSSGSASTKRKGNKSTKAERKNRNSTNGSVRRVASKGSDSSKKEKKNRDPKLNDTSKSTRRVRFAPLTKSAKEEDSKWVDTDKIAAELQNSQRSFLEWVGITGSSDEEEEITEKRRHVPIGVFKDSSSSQSKNSSSQEIISESPFSFGSLLNDWGDLSSTDESGDEYSYASTEDSGTITSTGDYTDAETTITSDDSQTTATNHNEMVKPVVQPVVQQEDDSRNYNEVRLTFQPIQQEQESGTNLLPALDDDGSADMEKHLFFDEHSQDSGSNALRKEDKTCKAGIPSQDRGVKATDSCQPIEDIPGHYEDMFTPVGKKPAMEHFSDYEGIIHSIEELEQTREPKGFCCSIKSLTRDHAKLSAKTGLPFHELSQKELSSIFPKIRSVRDDQETVVSEVIGTSKNYEVNLPARLQTSLTSNGPQSILEYEYEKGVHMFVVYKQFGSDTRNSMHVETAPTPPPKINKGNSSHNKVMIQVEASTVSITDCLIRQGLWWGDARVPLPNIPGADVVGKLYRIDLESSKKYKLSKGDRVLSLVRWGGNSRYLPVDPSLLVKVPEMIDPAAATTLPETYLAAFQVLHHGQGNGVRYRDTSLKGKNILVLGNANSNMGRAIVQLAAGASANQVHALAKPKHFLHVQELGMKPLNKESLQWWDLLNGRLDIIISLGEDVESMHTKALRSRGRAIILSNNKRHFDADKQKLGRPKDLISFRKKSKTVEHYDVYKEWEVNIERCKTDLQHLVSLLEQRKIAPYILDRIPLHKVARAHSLIETKHLSGFIVCEPWLVAKSRAVRL